MGKNTEELIERLLNKGSIIVKDLFCFNNDIVSQYRLIGKNNKSIIYTCYDHSILDFASCKSCNFSKTSIILSSIYFEEEALLELKLLGAEKVFFLTINSEELESFLAALE